MPIKTMTRIGLALLAASVAFAIPATAQRYDRGPPTNVQKGPGIIGGVPGRFDYYALVLSWSPTYCAGLPRGDYDPQCHRQDGRRYAFILHGLWPQYERGFPNDCPIGQRPFVPQSLIDKMGDIMPSPKLTIHEYRKHGTCSGLDPTGYYDLARKLYNKIKIPQRFANPPGPQMVGVGEVMQEFLAANPTLKPDMLAVACGGPGDRLKEVRVCFSREGEFRGCGGNENQRRLCSAQRMFVPPTRLGAPGGAERTAPGFRNQPPGAAPTPGSPLPMPVFPPTGPRSL